MALPSIVMLSTITPALEVIAPVEVNVPAMVVKELVPLPIVTSISSSASPSNILKPVCISPSCVATCNFNEPPSDPSEASTTSERILTNVVCCCASLSPINRIKPRESLSAPAAPLSVTKSLLVHWHH